MFNSFQDLNVAQVINIKFMDNTLETNGFKVNGGWSDFGAWTPCSDLTCQGGTTRRFRVCNNPAPEYGGNDCLGDNMEEIECNKDNCFYGKDLTSSN